MEIQTNQTGLSLSVTRPADPNSALANSVTSAPEEATTGSRLTRPNPPISSRRRTLKIETVGDFARGKILPRIRLTGQWLEQAGFKPGHRVEINHSKAGEMVLQFQETPTDSDPHRPVNCRDHSP